MDNAHINFFIRSLRRSWDRINKESLSGKLRAPVFAVDEAEGRAGYWQPESRTIGISRKHLVTDTWLEVELTLRHEMAHQIVSELFEVDHARPHGELFQRACIMIGLQGSPRIRQAVAPETERALRRVRKLMRLAESHNTNEASAAMAAASRLLLKYNLDLQNIDDKPYVWRWVGTPSGRISLERKLIARILQDHFLVQCLWVGTTLGKDKNVRVLELMGREHNIQMAEHVHRYLVDALQRLWRTFRKSHPERGGLAVRNEYRVGVLMGFADHLETQRTVHREEGLIWLGDPALDEFTTDRYPHQRSMARSYYRTGKAHKAGRKDGEQLRVRMPFKSDKKRNRGRAIAGSESSMQG